MAFLPTLITKLLATSIAVSPLLETEQEIIILAPLPTISRESGLVIYTQRQNKTDRENWFVPYELNCRDGRVRRLGQPMPSLFSGPIEAPQGEAGDWFDAMPFTLAKTLLERVCRKSG